MPSQKTRSKEDTWTTDELNKALDKTSDRRRPRDRDEERKRDRINGEEKSRRHRDEDLDRRHSRHKDDDNGREVRLTEEERERQREERRRRKEGKDGASSKDRKGKEIQFRGKSDNRDIELKDVIENDEDDRQTRHRSDRERERRHHDDGERERKHHDREQRHKDNDDADRERQRRHRDEDNDRDKRRKPRDEDDREKRRKHGADDDEEEDRRKRSDDKRDRRKDEDRKKDRDKDRDRHRDRDEDRTDRHKDRRDRDRHHKESEKDKEDRREREREERRREREERHKEDKKSSRHKEEEEKKEEEEDEYNYEEDFEDYEEDFEEDEDENEDDTPPPPRKNIQDSEVNDVLRALDAENERLLNSSSRSPQVSAQPSRRGYGDRSEREQDSDDGYQQTYQPRADRPRTAINFVSAKQRAVNRKTANKTMQRGRDLLQMLELDYASFDIMDLPPVNEYDLYIRAFGSSDTRQAYVQTNDDNVDRDIQTEEIDARNKWTQHPPDDFKGCGRGDGEKDVEDEEESQNKQNREQDLGRLNKFLEKAGQVIAILLEEGKEEEAGTRGKSQAHITVSEGYTQLDILPLLQGRHVMFTHFSPVQPNLLLAVYSPSPQVTEENPVSKRGIICVWNTNEPSYPQKILVCSSQPRCCCFSPVKPSLVFAGMVDGSIAMWDLREPSSIHQSTVVNDESYSLRYPTYDTASVLKEENHHSPVTSILPIYSYIDVSKSENQQSQASEDTSSGLSFQLVSTEESAVLNFWVVAEIGAPELAGSESDLGLAPGAGVKLLKSSTLTMSNPSKDARLQAGVRALDMALMPNDPNHLYVATDAGSVLHGIRFGKRTFPRSHGPLIESIVDVVSIDFSPFDQPCFLAGCADGTFSLYNTKSENPVISWPYVTKGRPVQCVRWSRSRPCVFYVLDVSSTLYVFDLLEGDTQPKNVENISKEKITSFSLTTDQRPDGLGPSGKDAQMLFSYEDGRTEIHTITKSLRVPEQLESDYLASYLYRF